MPNNFLISDLQVDYYSGFMRSTALVILIVFSVSALLGFSMFINLRPAQGFFGGILAAIWHFVQNKIWEFVTAIAKSFIMKFVSSFMIKLLQKLESLHVIKNILYYSDA